MSDGARSVSCAGLAGVLLLVLAAGASPAGEQREAIPRFRSGVDLVKVTATVRDAEGRLVDGLTRDDFRIFQDGRPVELTHFRAVTGGFPTAGEAALSPAAPPAAAADDAAPAARSEAFRINATQTASRRNGGRGDPTQRDAESAPKGLDGDAARRRRRVDSWPPRIACITCRQSCRRTRPPLPFRRPRRR